MKNKVLLVIPSAWLLSAWFLIEGIRIISATHRHFGEEIGYVLIGACISLFVTFGIYKIAKKIKRDRTRKRFFVGCYLTLTLPVIAPWLLFIIGCYHHLAAISFTFALYLSVAANPVIFAHITYKIISKQKHLESKAV